MLPTIQITCTYMYKEKSSWKTQVSFLQKNLSWIHESYTEDFSILYFLIFFFREIQKGIINPIAPLGLFLWENIQGVAGNLLAENMIHGNLEP